MEAMEDPSRFLARHVHMRLKSWGVPALSQGNHQRIGSFAGKYLTCHNDS